VTTWAEVARELALTTPLTRAEALEWTSWADAMGVTPQDGAPLLAQAIRALPDHRVGPSFLGAMAAVVKAGRR
jgi:hypothetical protein